MPNSRWVSSAVQPTFQPATGCPQARDEGLLDRVAVRQGLRPAARPAGRRAARPPRAPAGTARTPRGSPLRSSSRASPPFATITRPFTGRGRGIEGPTTRPARPGTEITTTACPRRYRALHGRMRFEWDERKRLGNLTKHGLDFRRAAQVFNGPNFGYPSGRHGEDRRVTVGIAHDQVVAVVWTGRSGVIRVISMRRARRAEARQYRQLFG